MTDEELRKIAEKATPGPWERGDRWHVQGASMCMCRERYGPLVAEVERDINGQLMLAHVHLGEEPWNEIGIVSSELHEGKYVQQVIVETDEYGTMSDEDALFVTTFNPHAVLALLDRVAEAEQALQRVRELHQYEVIGVHEGYGEEIWCPACEHHWPCPTIKALEGDE